MQQQIEKKEQEKKQNIANILCSEKTNFKVIDLNGGSGSFGYVLFVEEMCKNQNTQKYAVKAQNVFDPDLLVIDKIKIENCIKEAQILREIKHKNVVKVYDDFLIQNYHFLVMELCDSSLQKWVDSNKNKSISQKQFLHITNQLLDAVEYIHSLNYVLRDLSLNNILMCSDGTIKLCDFGLAKKFIPDFANQMLITNAYKGAALYYPPEILNSQNQFLYTQKGDIWAIGVCLQLIGGLEFQKTYFISKKVELKLDLDNLSNSLIEFILQEDPSKRPTIQMIRSYIYNNIILEKTIEVKGEVDYNERYKMIEFDYDDVLQVEKKCFQTILDDPNNVISLLQLGEVYLNYYKDFQKSLKCFQKVLKINSQDVDALLGIVQANSLMQYFKIEERMSPSEIEQTIQICENLSKNKYWRVYYINSLKSYFQMDYGLSLKNIQYSLNLNPDYYLSQMLQSISTAYFTFQPKQIEKAAKQCQEIINKNKFNHNYLAFNLMASLYRESYQNDLCFKYYQLCKKYTKNDLRVLSYLSTFYEAKGEIDKALKQQNKIMNINKDYQKQFEKIRKNNLKQFSSK